MNQERKSLPSLVRVTITALHSRVSEFALGSPSYVSSTPLRSMLVVRRIAYA